MRRSHRRRTFQACATALFLMAAGPVLGSPPQTVRVNLGPGGVQADNGGLGLDAAGVSASLRYILFSSAATNLVADRTTDQLDVFFTDLAIPRTLLVSRTWDGRAPTGPSAQGVMTPDGRYVAFLSLADNIVQGDTNNEGDIFIRNMRTGKAERVSLDSQRHEANSISIGPAISADGRYVAFYSVASNLVPDDTNDEIDVFVRDRLNGTTIRADVGPGGAEANAGASFFQLLPTVAMSANGRFVAFSSDATNLVPGDTNGTGDVFVRDLVKGTTELVSRGNNERADGPSYLPSLSSNGRYVAFVSAASNLVPGDTNGVSDIFIRDRKTQTTRRVNLGPGSTQANGPSDRASISLDGSTVAYLSAATNLVPDDTNALPDVFTSSTIGGSTARRSIAYDGSQANGASIGVPAVTARGRYVIFGSEATNLVPGDTNGVPDLFMNPAP